MDVSRRGFFSFFAGAGALSVPLPQAQSLVRRVKPRSMRIRAKRGAPSTRSVHLQIGDNSVVVDAPYAEHITARSNIELDVEDALDGDTRVHALWIDGQPFERFRVEAVRPY